MKASSLFVLVLVGLGGCKLRSSHVSSTISSESAPIASSSSRPQRVAQDWPALPALDAARPPAKPVAFPAGSKDKRLVIFAASWCGGCVASVPGDADLARRYAGRIEVAVALQEKTASFSTTPMARWLSGVRVYDEASTKALAKTCGVLMIPTACLLDGNRPLWTGSPDDGAAVLDGFLAGRLDDVRTRQKTADTVWKSAVDSPDKRAEAVAALHGLAGQENSIAWSLVDKSTPTQGELGLGVALARDAVDSTGALDFAILDTYELGLTKSGDDAEAVRVARRVIALCDAVKGECSEERGRAKGVLARAGTGETP